MKLFTDLNPNTTIVTPNRRLSATLIKKYNQLQLTQHNICWETIDILPFNTWIQRLWQSYCAENIEVTPHILTTQQEQILWEEILTQSPTNDALLQLSATAELAKSAWSILKQWQIDPLHSSLAITEDSSAFQAWAQSFKIVCQQNNWLDTSSLLDNVNEKIAAQRIKPQPHIILIGFTEYTPQQKKLFSLCTDAGIQIIYHATENQNLSIQRLSVTDEVTEIRNMACWAKALYQHANSSSHCNNHNNSESNNNHKNSNTNSIDNNISQNSTSNYSIGCIIPNLEKTREQIAQIFTSVFSEDQTLTLDITALPFNISAGKSLATFPIIHTALQLLNLHSSTLTYENINHLLHSPFIGNAESERIKRATFDYHLRHSNIHSTTLKQLIQPNDKISLTTHCPQLAERLAAFLAHNHTLEKKYSPSTWVKIFIELLTLLGWPGERSLNSHEYQVVQRWLELLNEYQALDNILSMQTYQNALHYLHNLAAKTVFQIQTPEAPIQILGLLEAADIPFDYIWVMGLDDATWPPAAKPNPFIPQRLQKTLQMPHANAEKELVYSTRLTEQLKNSAKHCIFSHALKNADSELRPSSLITNIKEITLTELNINTITSPAEKIFHTQMLDTLYDDQGPVISTDEKIHGGIKIFKQQAACPFKAFAEIRLHAQPLESLQIGLRPEDRGSIIHKTLELIWKKLQNSATLANTDDEALKNIINDCATIAIEKVTGKKITALRYLHLELQRLETLILAWLHFEKQRPAFTVIAEEQEQNITIGNIPVSLRIDRIDQLTDGKHVIIDYKTGKNNLIKYWFTDRPEEPQLPLYCLIDPDHSAAIAFAEIHPDNITLKGISKNDLDIPNITPIEKTHLAENRTWEQQIQQWHSVLTTLGNDFNQGKAAVNPKNEETCQYCHLQTLCRVHEPEIRKDDSSIFLEAVYEKN